MLNRLKDQQSVSRSVNSYYEETDQNLLKPFKIINHAKAIKDQTISSVLLMK